MAYFSCAKHATMQGIEKKNVVVTGASRGIGFETALAVAAEGHTVIALARTAEGLQKLAEKAAEENLRIHTHTLDLHSLGENTAAAVFEPYETIDVLINNAGLLINKPFTETTMAHWRETFETNLFSAVALIQRLLPQLGKSTAAHVVNIGSMGGYQGSGKFPGLSAYSASKAALANLTECLAEELRPQNITVNCLALGAVNTEMLQAAFPGYQAPVSSEEMGRLIAQFALHQHRFFNGKILPVSVSTP